MKQIPDDKMIAVVDRVYTLVPKFMISCSNKKKPTPEKMAETKEYRIALKVWTNHLLNVAERRWLTRKLVNSEGSTRYLIKDGWFFDYRPVVGLYVLFDGHNWKQYPATDIESLLEVVDIKLDGVNIYPKKRAGYVEKKTCEYQGRIYHEIPTFSREAVEHLKEHRWWGDAQFFIRIR